MARSTVINKGYADEESGVFTGFSGFASLSLPQGPLLAPKNVDVPMISGPTGLSAVVGDIINCTMGNWTGEPTSYAYQWCANGITQAENGPFYVVQVGDAGKEMACIVTATNAAGSTQAPPSNRIDIPAARAGKENDLERKVAEERSISRGGPQTGGSRRG